MRRTEMSRRAFMGRSALAAGSAVLSLTALGRLSARAAYGALGGVGYGPLAPVAPDNDPGGFEILALPAGFTYVTFSIIGSTMSDGNPVPVAHDGMAAFAHPTDPGIVRLVRNHEDRANPTLGSVLGPAATRYDANGRGGTTTLDFDEATRTLVRDFVSLNGTIVNCAGGIGFGQQSWITCEETTASQGTGAAPGWAKNHGYCFEVPLGLAPNTTATAVPIPAMGRFAHEAVCVDQRTGIVYQTEDGGSGVGSGLYRYVPDDPAALLAGGKLQMLAVRGKPQYDTRDGQKVGRWIPVVWVDIASPDPANAGNSSPDRVFTQGWDLGGAKFNRLEGCWWDDPYVFFVSTSGGDAKNGDVNPDGFAEGYGQVWQYRPSGRSEGHLRLIFESPGQEVLDSPDNLLVTPRGGIILCEDDAGGSDGDTHPLAPGITDVNRLIGLTVRGEAFEFAVNRLNDAEFAGACFGPTGKTLFVNIFGDGSAGSGMTLAITGPWSAGPL